MIRYLNEPQNIGRRNVEGGSSQIAYAISRSADGPQAKVHHSIDVQLIVVGVAGSFVRKVDGPRAMVEASRQKSIGERRTLVIELLGPAKCNALEGRKYAGGDFAYKSGITTSGADAEMSDVDVFAMLP